MGGGVPASATSNLATPVQLTQPKALEEFINESLPDSPLHRLEVSERGVQVYSYFLAPTHSMSTDLKEPDGCK